jgi:DNA repair protein RadC
MPVRFLDRESVRVVLLDAKQHLIKVATVSQGTVNESLAHPREIFKPVIAHSAYSFILVHNHPSATRPLLKRICGLLGELKRLAEFYNWTLSIM